MSVDDLPDEVILDQVRILKLIDHDVTAKLPVGFQDLRITSEKNGNKSEEISKIEGIVPLQIFLISLVNQGQSFLKNIELRRMVLIRCDAFVLQLIDGGLDGSGIEHPEVHVQFLHYGLEVAFLILLIINDKISLKAQGLDMAPQDAGAG
jgi:hypothetical protein